MELRMVSYHEFDELLNLMDLAFGFSAGNKFKEILPKLYFKDNKNMHHYGIYDDGKLVSSIGLYDVILESPYGKLKCGGIGGVATHPEYRNRGYFSLLLTKIIEYAKKNSYDLLFLSGDKLRYNRYGFEEGGRSLSFTISQKGIKKYSGYEISLLKDIEDIKKCLELYNEELIHSERTVDNFYSCLVSWKCMPYVVKYKDEVIGYYSLKNPNLAFEFIYKKGYRNIMLNAILEGKERVTINTATSELDDDLIAMVEEYHLRFADMFNILNYESVLHFLNVDPNKLDEIKAYKGLKSIRKLLGNHVEKSEYSKLDMFIPICDKS